MLNGYNKEVGRTFFNDCIVAVDFLSKAYLIDAPLLKGNENGLRNNLFTLLHDTGDGSFICEVDNKTQGIYLADIEYISIEHYYPLGEIEYGFEIEMNNLRFITIER